MADYFTIQKNGEHETIIKKSRFICHLGRVHTEAEAKDFIALIQKKEYKANHNVPAYLLGDHDEIQHASDDGEPAGTAGVPMLKVLQEMQLHDVVAVTTRYFGGIKLGAGGLIRAYAGSVTAAVHAIGITQRLQQRQLTVTLTYSNLGSVQHYLETVDQPIASSEYTDKVTLHLAVNVAEVKPLTAALTDLLNGQLTIKEGGLQFAEVPIASH